MSKAVLLGEALPPLRLVFQDSHGNTVPVSSDATPAATLQVLEAGPGGGRVVLQELQALADAVSVLALHRLQCFGLVPTYFTRVAWFPDRHSGSTLSRDATINTVCNVVCRDSALIIRSGCCHTCGNMWFQFWPCFLRRLCT